nr:hypothetical protein [Neobacillus sp. Marseille-Q6967]
MFKLQILDASTQEIIREETYGDSEIFNSVMKAFKIGQDYILFDRQRKVLKGVYVSHSILNENDGKTYKINFRVSNS